MLPGQSFSLTSLQVTGGVFSFHFLVHLIAISIDPAEASVRLKNYSQPMPTFDRSKHPHVIQNQYCHLCEVTVCVSGAGSHGRGAAVCPGLRRGLRAGWTQAPLIPGRCLAQPPSERRSPRHSPLPPPGLSTCLRSQTSC